MSDSLIVAFRISSAELVRLSNYISHCGAIDPAVFLSQDEYRRLDGKDAVLFQVVISFLSSERNFGFPKFPMPWRTDATNILSQHGIHIYAIASSEEARDFVRRLREVAPEVADGVTL